MEQGFPQMDIILRQSRPAQQHPCLLLGPVAPRKEPARMASTRAGDVVRPQLALTLILLMKPRTGLPLYTVSM